jgi:acyl-CoA reductase-like NAD-dependent aldehyde dehydrogenase
MKTVELPIAGRRVAGREGKTFECVDPFTGQVATRAAPASSEDADAAVAAAHYAFPAWSGLPATERRARLLKAADIMDSMTPEFIATGIAETGSVPGWYGVNVMLASAMLRKAASITTQISGRVLPSGVPGNVAMAVRRPCGVMLGLAPWNAPAILGTRAVARPLASRHYPI